MALPPEPVLRAIARLVVAVLVIGGPVTFFEPELAARSLAPLGAYLDWIDGTFRTVDLGVVSANGEAVIRRVSTPAYAHELGGHVVFADTHTRLTAAAGAGMIFQPAIFILALIFAWPWRDLRVLGMRAAVALPLVLGVVLLDVPMMLYGFTWYQEVSRLDPDRWSPLILWADFMNAGGRFALGIAAAAVAVAIADRLWPFSRLSPGSPGRPATAPPAAPPSPPAGRAA